MSSPLSLPVSIIYTQPGFPVQDLANLATETEIDCVTSNTLPLEHIPLSLSAQQNNLDLLRNKSRLASSKKAYHSLHVTGLSFLSSSLLSLIYTTHLDFDCTTLCWSLLIHICFLAHWDGEGVKGMSSVSYFLLLLQVPRKGETGTGISVDAANER